MLDELLELLGKVAPKAVSQGQSATNLPLGAALKVLQEAAGSEGGSEDMLDNIIVVGPLADYIIYKYKGLKNEGYIVSDFTVTSSNVETFTEVVINDKLPRCKYSQPSVLNPGMWYCAEIYIDNDDGSLRLGIELNGSAYSPKGINGVGMTIHNYKNYLIKGHYQLEIPGYGTTNYQKSSEITIPAKGKVSIGLSGKGTKASAVFYITSSGKDRTLRQLLTELAG